MTSPNQSSNRKPALRLLFIFRIFVILVCFTVGIFLLSTPRKMDNQYLFAVLFLGYGLLRAFRTYWTRKNQLRNGNE